VTSNDGTVPPVDLDLLADYLDDVLPAGPAAMVANRIDSDARWASAAERLRATTPAVKDMLRTTNTEAMPDALLDRFLAALPDRMPVPASLGDAASAHDASGAHAADSDPRTRDGRDAPPTRVISLDDRRRRPRWSGLAKVAAVLIVLAGVGTGIGLGLHATTSATKSSSGAASTAEAPFGSSAGGVAAQVTASGRDYSRELWAAPTAPHVQSPVVPTPNTPGGASGHGSDSASAPGAPSALQRLASGGLPGCLAQVQDQFSSIPLKADFAFYAGTPAVVVTLSNATVVAVGAECGLPGLGADVLATGR
jgi:anti-sigma factor RsiW